MDDVTYEIVDWNLHFEKSDTRKCKSMLWVPIPTRQDGAGYRRVMSHKSAVDIFAAWIAILQIAAKMPVRGVLKKDGRSLDASDLAIASGLPERIFELAITVLTGEKIGWIRAVSG